MRIKLLGIAVVVVWSVYALPGGDDDCRALVLYKPLQLPCISEQREQLTEQTPEEDPVPHSVGGVKLSAYVREAVRWWMNKQTRPEGVSGEDTLIIMAQRFVSERALQPVFYCSNGCDTRLPVEVREQILRRLRAESIPIPSFSKSSCLGS